MSDGLRSLEKLRSDAVEQARAALSKERVQLAQAEALVREHAACLVEVSTRLRAACDAYALDTAADYAWAERSQRAARLRHTECARRLTAAQAQRAHVQERVQKAERRVLDAELGRRAVGHVVAQREAVRAQKLELRAEEDAADAHRARPR